MQPLSRWYGRIACITGSASVSRSVVIQTLWSDYGVIARVHLTGGMVKSVIVKIVEPPSNSLHPRGWNTSRSHDRKIRSYQVECEWYLHYSSCCNENCRIPRLYGLEVDKESALIVMEDLDLTGFSERRSTLNVKSVTSCLDWLAAFHARFMGVMPTGLWPEGTYWHLSTRPDELLALQDTQLRNAAQEIDQRLTNCRYKTLLHGDAKVANFCFSEDQLSVAAVDFQYVGGGCGMKDVAYLLGSCLSELECEQSDEILLQFYFDRLKMYLLDRSETVDFRELEAEWRILYKFAWTDFYRFLKGWMPGHKKINRYTLAIANDVYRELGA